MKCCNKRVHIFLVSCSFLPSLLCAKFIRRIYRWNWKTEAPCPSRLKTHTYAKTLLRKWSKGSLSQNRGKTTNQNDLPAVTDQSFSSNARQMKWCTFYVDVKKTSFFIYQNQDENHIWWWLCSAFADEIMWLRHHKVCFWGIFIPWGKYSFIFQVNDRHFVNLAYVININLAPLFIDQKIVVMTK